MNKKQRIDLLLVEKGLIETQEKAKRSIMAGIVYADGERVDKPGTKVNENSHLIIKGERLPYVSRGGLKLKKAIDTFQFDLKGKIVLDIGSSTRSKTRLCC